MVLAGRVFRPEIDQFAIGEKAVAVAEHGRERLLRDDIIAQQQINPFFRLIKDKEAILAVGRVNWAASAR